MENYYTIAGEKTRYQIELSAVKCGSDLSVTICGGSHYHVGAAALALPATKESENLPAQKSTVSILCTPGHRDDEVAKMAARRLANEFGCVVSVSAGIHIDGATADELAVLVTNCNTCISWLIEKINEPGTPHAE